MQHLRYLGPLRENTCVSIVCGVEPLLIVTLNQEVSSETSAFAMAAFLRLITQILLQVEFLLPPKILSLCGSFSWNSQYTHLQFSKCIIQENHSGAAGGRGGMLKCRFLSCSCGDSDSVGLEWGPGVIFILSTIFFSLQPPIVKRFEKH